MTGLVESASKVRLFLDEMAQASHRHRTRMGEVNPAVGDIDAVTQRNAAHVEEIAAAAQSLVKQARSLTPLIERFDLVPDR